MIYVKPDIKRNKNVNNDKEDNNFINNDFQIQNRMRGKSTNQRFRNSDYKLYDKKNNNRIINQNSPLLNRNLNINIKNIISNNIYNNDDNAHVYTKKDNTTKMVKLNNNTEENNNNINIKNNELLKILINEGEEVGLEHKIELISENNNKTKSKNKSGEGSCCTISTKSLEDEKIEGDNKEDTGNKIENKTIIIGKEREKKNEDDKK